MRLDGHITQAANPIRWPDISPEVIRLFMLIYARCPLSLRNVDDLPERDHDRFLLDRQNRRARVGGGRFGSRVRL